MFPNYFKAQAHLPTNLQISVKLEADYPSKCQIISASTSISIYMKVADDSLISLLFFHLKVIKLSELITDLTLYYY